MNAVGGRIRTSAVIAIVVVMVMVMVMVGVGVVVVEVEVVDYNIETTLIIFIEVQPLNGVGSRARTLKPGQA